MIVYPVPCSVNHVELVSLGTPGDLGGRVLEGAPVLTGRIDFQSGALTAGIFASTAGKVEIHFLFTEHATVLEGVVRLTDEAGQSHTYHPGDSYLIRQGEVIIWEVISERMIKAFFNITGPAAQSSFAASHCS